MPVTRPNLGCEWDTRASADISSAAPDRRDVCRFQEGEVGGGGVGRVEIWGEGDLEGFAAFTGKELVANLVGFGEDAGVTTGQDYSDGRAEV